MNIYDSIIKRARKEHRPKDALRHKVAATPLVRKQYIKRPEVCSGSMTFQDHSVLVNSSIL